MRLDLTGHRSAYGAQSCQAVTPTLHRTCSNLSTVLMETGELVTGERAGSKRRGCVTSALCVVAAWPMSPKNGENLVKFERT